MSSRSKLFMPKQGVVYYHSGMIDRCCLSKSYLLTIGELRGLNKLRKLLLKAFDENN